MLAGAEAIKYLPHGSGTEDSPLEAVALMKDHLRKPVQPERLPGAAPRLLVDLDGDSFSVREKARKELEELGDRARASLEEALKKKPSLETHRRIEALLARLSQPIRDPETLRGIRAIAILEAIGTPEARKVLEKLASGMAEAQWTQEAKSALKRLTPQAATTRE